MTAMLVKFCKQAAESKVINFEDRQAGQAGRKQASGQANEW